MVINEAYLFLSNSPKRQSMFELAVVKLMPASSHKKLPGLCRTRWVERHTCYEVFLNFTKLSSFLDVTVSPNDYPQLESSDGSWNWDRETKIRVQGLKLHFLCSPPFQLLKIFWMKQSLFLQSFKSVTWMYIKP